MNINELEEVIRYFRGCILKDYLEKDIEKLTELIERLSQNANQKTT